jgi:hypothetical protein
MAGAHTSEKRWYRNQNINGNDSIADMVQVAAVNVIKALENAESMFGEMQELFAYTGGTMQGLADQLFKEKWSARLVDPQVPDVYETQANATELGMTQDAFDAVTAMHELYQAMNNVAIAQEDRLAQLRRMS